MDSALRILHIVFGVYWAGATFFDVFILEPRLRALGPAHLSRVYRVLLPIMSPTLGGSCFIILGTGIAMALRLRGGSIDTYLTTGWGLAMLVAFVAVVAAIIWAGIHLPVGSHLKRLENTMKGCEPNADEARQLEEVMNRARTLERVQSVLILIALVAMPVSRFV